MTGLKVGAGGSVGSAGGRTRVRAAAALVCAAAGVLSAIAPAAGQQAAGRIVGRVTSTATGEALPSAQVFIETLSIGALTDLDGRYTLAGVPAGAHRVTVSLIGYTPKSVSGVGVQPGATELLDISVAPQAVGLAAITVEAAVEKGNTTALMTERRRSATVSDAIGRDQISRTPDGTAAAALRRVPGVSVVDGKYVYVRGLGERYGATTLNGAPVPSPEPDRKVVPLDLVPSSLLESVVTAKTYSPDQPGDYAGGLVQIRTRDFPSFRMLKLSAGLSLDTESSFQEGLGYSGGRYDFLGFDDGSRGLPALVPTSSPVRAGVGGMSPETVERIGEAFGAGAWGPIRKEIPVASSFGLSFGDQLELGGSTPLGFLASLTHGVGYANRSKAVERVFTSEGAAAPEVDYLGDATTRSVTSGALLNASLRITPDSRVTLATIFNNSVDDEARILEGYREDAGADLRNTRLRYVRQSLFSAQLSGEHRVGLLNDGTLKWRGAASRAARLEPGTREVLYRRAPDGRFLFENFIQSGSVFHQRLVENGYSGGLDATLPFRFRGLPAELAAGAAADARSRSVYSRRFRFLLDGSLSEEVRALAPDPLFSEEHIGPDGFEVVEATFREDNYDADQTVVAGYGMLEAELLPRLRLLTGVRVEATEMEVTPRDLFDTPLEPLAPARLRARDLLPAVNLTYALTGDMNLRLAASRTLARPQLRELAPFGFADYAGGFLVIGNPELERSRIANLDARWEWFAGAYDVFAVSAFYKEFSGPIEAMVVPSSELIKSWVNAEGAEVYGAEIELRSTLGFLGPALEGVSVNGNLTLARSRVVTGDSARVYLPGTGAAWLPTFTRERALQGQSPYMINLGVGYFADAVGTRATLLFNRFGRRIDAVGARGLPDVYEEARSQLDLTIEQPLPRGLDLKLSASRILGNEVTFTQGGDVLRQYDLGRSVSVSIGWQPGRQ